MDSTDNSALMTLDLKRSRIRIHKSTLKKLNDPKYIQFLINPEEMFIAFLGSDKPLAGGTANKVNLVRVPNQSVEFYSNSLLEGVISTDSINISSETKKNGERVSGARRRS